MFYGNKALSLMLGSNMNNAAFQLHINVAIAKQCNLYFSYNNKKSSILLCILTT